VLNDDSSSSLASRAACREQVDAHVLAGRFLLREVALPSREMVDPRAHRVSYGPSRAAKRAIQRSLSSEVIGMRCHSSRSRAR
jgi:hypothetical protein